VVGGKKMRHKKSIGEHIFDTSNYIILTILALACLYPMLYILFASLSKPILLLKHTGLLYKPLGFTLAGYKIVLGNPNIASGYFNTIIYVVCGTAVNILLTSMGAYVLSRKNIMIKKAMMIMIVITMYFGGGIIPLFLLVKELGMYNSRLALIIPSAIASYNLIVMKTSFQAIPDSLDESAKIDGANDFIILFKIILPVAKATVAVMVLFYAVGHWNGWFRAMIFLRDRSKFPLQLLLREILLANQQGGTIEGVAIENEEFALMDELIKYCTIIVATVPILFIYPFCQKYFMKGVMLGSIKG
jgi:putative aldouronate transport system permease protein